MSYAVTNPATGETVKTYDTISDAGLEAAIAAADETHRTWSKSTTVDERATLIRRVAELHRERRQELAELIVREMGKPIAQALSEVDFAADIYEYYADHSPHFLKDEPIDLLAGEGSAVIRRSSLGVLLGVMPWNFPYYQVARFAAPNLVVGNTILLKPAHQCPESAEAIQTMFADAGFPDGAYQTMLASNDQIAEVIADSRIQGVSLTGSERAGAAYSATPSPRATEPSRRLRRSLTRRSFRLSGPPGEILLSIRWPRLTGFSSGAEVRRVRRPRPPA